MGRLHLVSIAPEVEISERLKNLATEFDYSFRSYTSVDQFSEALGDDQVMLVVLSAAQLKSSAEIAGSIQVTKQLAPDAFVVVLVDKKISPNDVSFIKKSGANLIFLESDFLTTSQIEFVCSQVIRGSLIPIKATELKVNTTPDFSVYVVMPLNKKVLPVLMSGATLTEAKHTKLQTSTELYIRREDIKKFEDYCGKHLDLSAGGLAARCRLKYLNLCRAHSELVFLLIDQGQATSFTQGKALLDDCSKLANDLLTNLASVEDASAIINNSAIGESGSAERSTAVAAMAGLLSLNLTGMQPNDVVMAGLISDIGMMDLEPRVLRKIRQQGISSLNPEEASAYQKHPILSVNMCLVRKLPLPDKIRNIVMCSHEYNNGKGFPNNYFEDRIPIESQVILFTNIVDEASLVKMGERKKPLSELRKEVMDREGTKCELFSAKMATELKKVI